MKRKIIYGALSIIALYVVANVFAYNRLKHSDAPLYQPNFPIFRDGSIDQRYITAVYKNHNNDSVCLCRFSFVDGYKYIFYQPQEMVSGYTIIFNKSYINYSNEKGKIIKAVTSDSNQILVGGPATSLLYLDSISNQILVLDTLNNQTDVFNLDSIYPHPKSEISWYEKLTWGPIFSRTQMWF